MSLEWSASTMCAWIRRLFDLDACVAGTAERETETESERNAQAVWSESAAKAELTRTQQENQQMWEQFENEQEMKLFRRISDYAYAQYYIRSAEKSIRDSDAYQKIILQHSAEVTAELDKLHFTAAEAQEQLRVFAELADAVNQSAGLKPRSRYRQACVRMAAWTDYAAELLNTEYNRLRLELHKLTAETEEKAAKRKQEFADRLRAMWEKSRADGSAAQESDAENSADATVSRSAVNTAAQIKERNFCASYDPERLETDYLARLAKIKAPANYSVPETMPPDVIFGTLVFDMKAAGFHRETIAFLARTYPYLCTDTEFRMPLVLPLDAAMNCVFRFPDADVNTVMQLASQLLFELLMMLSPKHMQLLRITDDHHYLDKLAVFQRLIDPQDKESAKAVYGTVRMKTEDILSGLDELLAHRSYVSQQVLQGVHESLRDYYLENPKADAPYTVLTAMLDPDKANAAVFDKIAEIADAGPSCGIFTWLFDTSLKEPENDLPDGTLGTVYSRMRHCFTYDRQSGRYRYDLLTAQLENEELLWWEPLPFPNAAASVLKPEEQRRLMLRTQQDLMDLMRTGSGT